MRIPAGAWRTLVPGARALCRRAAAAALAEVVAETGTRVAGEIAIVLADDATLRDLNRTFRGKDQPTNVLSFPATDDGSPVAGDWPVIGDVPIGDVAIAVETVDAEARAQMKTVPDHLAHLVVHGVLHLLGYTHDRKADARRMEGAETRALASLGIPDPYVIADAAPKAMKARPGPRRRA